MTPIGRFGWSFRLLVIMSSKKTLRWILPWSMIYFNFNQKSTSLRPLSSGSKIDHFVKEGDGIRSWRFAGTIDLWGESGGHISCSTCTHYIKRRSPPPPPPKRTSRSEVVATFYKIVFYLNAFCSKLQSVIRPLLQLTNKKTEFQWWSDHTSAFEN